MLKHLAMLWLFGVWIVVTVHLKMLQPTPYDDSNEPSYPITSSIEAKSCDVCVVHQRIYVKCVSIIVYAHLLIDKTLSSNEHISYFVHMCRILYAS